jgi:hypothetical protein
MKVVCVDAEVRRFGSSNVRGPEIIPEVGRVYTIREIGYLYPSPLHDHLCVRLVEVVNRPLLYAFCDEPLETAFGVSRFRRVQPRKTDISIFTAMLNPKKQVVDA